MLHPSRSVASVRGWTDGQFSLQVSGFVKLDEGDEESEDERADEHADEAEDFQAAEHTDQNQDRMNFGAAANEAGTQEVVLRIR